MHIGSTVSATCDCPVHRVKASVSCATHQECKEIQVKCYLHVVPRRRWNEDLETVDDIFDAPEWTHCMLIENMKKLLNSAALSWKEK